MTSHVLQVTSLHGVLNQQAYIDHFTGHNLFWQKKSCIHVEVFVLEIALKGSLISGVHTGRLRNNDLRAVDEPCFFICSCKGNNFLGAS